MVKTRKLLYSSPSDLKSSLQNGRSPPGGGGGGARKVKSNDMVVDEILKERRAAIESGNLKGKRLFEAMGIGVSEMDFGGTEEIICHNLDGLAQESEVRSDFSYCSDDETEDFKADKGGLSPFSHHCSYSSSSSSSFSFCICDNGTEREEEEEKMMVEASEQEEKRVLNGDQERYGAGWMVAIGWLTIAFIVCVFGIISKRSFGNHGVGNEVIDFPT
ncbi:hypothetical protein SADUNF_Sadunf15G0087000 [Salix dunnii]|uniref:Uncharacterized protein n=1 Tax=Salix dunnii TaxID=1413687 RepID=A0A835JJ19_9ROSI|nr:hypothetical protein SADUNF_Sadunf15G0087000 [Salix dunnii]